MASSPGYPEINIWRICLVVFIFEEELMRFISSLQQLTTQIKLINATDKERPLEKLLKICYTIMGGKICTAIFPHEEILTRG